MWAYLLYFGMGCTFYLEGWKLTLNVYTAIYDGEKHNGDKTITKIFLKQSITSHRLPYTDLESIPTLQIGYVTHDSNLCSASIIFR